VPVFPTPFYETVMMAIIFIILLVFVRNQSTRCLIFYILIFAGIERYLIESIRVNYKFDFLGKQFTQAEIISIIFLIVGISCLIYLFK